MTPNVPEPNPAGTPESVDLPPLPSTPVVDTSRRTKSPWLLALVAAILASGLSWGICEAVGNRFKAEVQGDPSLGPMQSGVTVESLDRAETKNSALTHAIEGAVFGLFLGLAGGISRGSMRAAVGAGVVGLIVGGALGALVSLGLIPIVLKGIDPLSDNLIPPLLSHAGLWAPIGATVGLAFSLGRGGGKDQVLLAIVGGIMGALLAVGIYEVLGAMAFPLDRTTRPVSAATTTRLLAHALLGILSSLGTVFFLTSVHSAPKTASH